MASKSREEKRDLYLQKKYGISLEEYNAKLKKQNGVCFICQKPPKENRSLCVDHNHQSGEVRGLLDFTCNKLLVGRIERISKTPRVLLNGLVKYFKKYKMKGEE